MTATLRNRLCAGAHEGTGASNNGCDGIASPLLERRFDRRLRWRRSGESRRACASGPRRGDDAIRIRDQGADVAVFDEGLRRAIQRAYDVFLEFDFGGDPATVCSCPCCVSEETALQLGKTPRSKIGAELMREYLGSAHEHDEESSGRELRHFLPRVFELLAGGEEVCFSGNEVALMRLGPFCGGIYADYRRNWSPQEIETIDAFFEAYWLAALNERPSLFRRPGTGELLFEESRAKESLCMIALAGGEIERFLSLWDDQRSLSADLNLAALVSDATPRAWASFPRTLEDGHLGGPQWDFAPDAERRALEWLLDERQHGRLIEASLASAPDSSEAQALAEAAEELQRVLVRRRAGA
jgi:hypothetical protein